MESRSIKTIDVQLYGGPNDGMHLRVRQNIDDLLFPSKGKCHRYQMRKLFGFGMIIGGYYAMDFVETTERASDD